MGQKSLTQLHVANLVLPLPRCVILSGVLRFPQPWCLLLKKGDNKNCSVTDENITHLCSSTTYIENIASPWVGDLGSGDGEEESALNIWVVLEYFGQHLHVIELSSCPEMQLRLRHKIEVNCFCVIIFSIWTGRRVPSHSAVFMEDKGFVTAHRWDRI